MCKPSLNPCNAKPTPQPTPKQSNETHECFHHTEKKDPYHECITYDNVRMIEHITIIEHKKELLPKDYVVKDGDVICGRGRKCYNHFGNRELRRIVISMVDEYAVSTCKHDKSYIISRIVAQMRTNGGFVKEDGNGQWYDVGDFAAREKISQLFRDALHEKYKSSTAFKRKKRQEKKESDDFFQNEIIFQHSHQKGAPFFPPFEPDDVYHHHHQRQQQQQQQLSWDSKAPFSPVAKRPPVCESHSNDPIHPLHTSSSLSILHHEEEDPLEPIPISQAFLTPEEPFWSSNTKPFRPEENDSVRFEPIQLSDAKDDCQCFVDPIHHPCNHPYDSNCPEPNQQLSLSPPPNKEEYDSLPLSDRKPSHRELP